MRGTVGAPAPLCRRPSPPVKRAGCGWAGGGGYTWYGSGASALTGCTSDPRGRPGRVAAATGLTRGGYGGRWGDMGGNGGKWGKWGEMGGHGGK